MEWTHPESLYLILPCVCGWLIVSLVSRRKKQRAAAAFVAETMRARILPHESIGRFWLKLGLREIALTLALLALAGPRFGTYYENVIPRGSDLYVLMDVSRSMLAQDVPPSRLGRAKADVASLVNRLEGERIGLIAFAGQAVVKCPLTVDYDSFRRSLDELDTNSAPRGGTAIGDAIRKSLEVFPAHSERDQAILLITDGDDQQSYPREAAQIAAERNVTIFTIGLGDAEQGARVPKEGVGAQFVEYEGKQIWSKLDGALLKEIALKTSGVYIPVGTRAYDLGELYAEHLKGRRGKEEETQKRLRRSEQYQPFLAIALFALLCDLMISPYSPFRNSIPVETSERSDEEPTSRRTPRRRAAIASSILICGFLAVSVQSSPANADEPGDKLREGLQHYRHDEFDKAQEKFSAARDEFAKVSPDKAAVAAFDKACAAHRLGKLDDAREAYLQAGLSPDRKLASAAHFNLGTMLAEEGRRMAGERPEEIAPEKRQEVLDQLTAAVGSFRQSLDLEPTNSSARRDIELIRQWIRFYTVKWHERDRQKRRDETNLLKFLEYLMDAQKTMRESVAALSPRTAADEFAEWKRLQTELAEEIPPLKEKIKQELSGAAQQNGNPATIDAQQLQQGIELLQEWADAAGQQMQRAADELKRRSPSSAARNQQSAYDELEKIWEAVIPFAPLLAHDLADQTKIVRDLEPSKSSTAANDEEESANAFNTDEPDPSASRPPAGSGVVATGNGINRYQTLQELQERTRRRTELLKLKAEAELEQLARAPATEQPADDEHLPDEEKAKTTVTPEQRKAGIQKAVELAPQAAEKMAEVVQALKRRNDAAAYPPAEEARKILEEISKSQPPDQKQDQQPDQDKSQQEQSQDQQKSDQSPQDKNDRSKSEQEQPPDPPKTDKQKSNEQEQKQDDRKKEKDEQQNSDKQKSEQKDQKKSEKKQRDEKEPRSGKPGEKSQPMSKDQAEEMLRRVRERQEAKRERDRKMKARISGVVPVEKDW